MDGTLLDDRKDLPPHFFEAAERLGDEGVRLMIASGRQYDNILEQFKPIAGRFTFMAENGGLVFENGKCLIEHSLPAEKWIPVYRASRTIPSATPLFLGVHSSYATKSDDSEFVKNWIRYCVRRTMCRDMETEPFLSDRIVKIAIFDGECAEKNCMPTLSRFQQDFNVAPTDLNWVNVMPKGVSKGAALRDYAEKTGIRPAECMTFGDYLNDAEMLAFSGYGYAMANSHPDLLAKTKLHAPANTENGVMKVLADYFPYLRDLVGV